MKKIIIALYALIVIVLGGATFVEHIQGRDFALQHIYGAWWFSLLWALLTAFGVAWIVKRRMRRWPILLLHASFVLILTGALLTHLTSKQGVIHLRMGETTDEYYEAATETGMRVAHLPFQLRLDSFNIIYHEGTQAAADYETHFTIIEGQQQTEACVSMNHIFSHRGYRFYQSSYDEDQRGSILSLNADPWGIPVTYVGYALLFFSLVYMLIDPRGTFRRLLRSPLLQRAVLLILIFHCSLFTCHAAPTLPREQADAFAQLHILYNDRICPIETYALDFTKKLYGKRHYGSYSATQVLLGFIFWGDEIDTINTFDTETQRRIDYVEKITVVPSVEVLINDKKRLAEKIEEKIKLLRGKGSSDAKEILHNEADMLLRGIVPGSGLASGLCRKQNDIHIRADKGKIKAEFFLYSVQWRDKG